MDIISDLQNDDWAVMPKYIRESRNHTRMVPEFLKGKQFIKYK